MTAPYTPPPFVSDAYAGMLSSGATPDTPIIPPKTRHLAALARFANGGTTPTPLLDTARAGAEAYKYELYMDRIRTGTTVDSKATWDPATFTLTPGSSRHTTMALTKDSALLLHSFELGTNGFGIQHVIPLHAGTNGHDVTAAVIASWDAQAFSTYTFDNRLLDNPTPSGKPLPSLPLGSMRDGLDRLVRLIALLLRLYPESLDLATIAEDLPTPPCTVTAGLEALAMAFEALLSQRGEFGLRAGLDALTTDINDALSDYSAAVRTMAHNACLRSAPSPAQQQQDRLVLAAALKSAFGSLISKLMSQPDTTFIRTLGAFGPTPSSSSAPAAPAFGAAPAHLTTDPLLAKHLLAGLPNTLCYNFLTGRCHGHIKCTRSHDLPDPATLHIMLRNALHHFQPDHFPAPSSSAMVVHGKSGGPPKGGPHA